MRIEGWRRWYWMIAGGLIGVNLLDFSWIGLPFVGLGLVMLVAGAILRRGNEFWLAMVALGAVPALILAFDILSTPTSCTSVTLASGQGYACGEVGPAYYALAAIFAGIAVLGIAWPLARRLWTRQRAR
jgi:hypothetical protein